MFSHDDLSCNRKTLPRQGRERVLTRGATLLRSIERLILTRCDNGHSRGNYTGIVCWFPDSQATSAQLLRGRFTATVIFPLSRSMMCAYSSCSASILLLVQFC